MPLEGEYEPSPWDWVREQVEEYEASGGPLDAIYKILNTLSMTHPFNTLRAAELKRWVEGGTYAKVLAGDYAHRGAEQQQRPYTDDLGDAASHYVKGARDVAVEVAEAAKRAASAFAAAFKENKPK